MKKLVAIGGGIAAAAVAFVIFSGFNVLPIKSETTQQSDNAQPTATQTMTNSKSETNPCGEGFVAVKRPDYGFDCINDWYYAKFYKNGTAPQRDQVTTSSVATDDQTRDCYKVQTNPDEYSVFYNCVPEGTPKSVGECFEESCYEWQTDTCHSALPNVPYDCDPAIEKIRDNCIQFETNYVNRVQPLKEPPTYCYDEDLFDYLNARGLSTDGLMTLKEVYG